MAKKRPPGWQKKQGTKKSEGSSAGPNFTMLEGEEARAGLDALLERMEKNPENFPMWGYSDADGNDHEEWNPDFLKEGGKGDRP